MSLAVLADHMASKGRNGDTMLVHMAPEEVAGLHALALSHGGYMTINPETGLPEAFSLKGLLKSALPMIAGFALGPAGFGIVSSALGAGALVGGATALATGSLQKGLMAGLGAYGGANLGSALVGGSSAGASAAAAEAAKAASSELAATEAFAGANALSGEAANKFVQDAATKAYADFAAKPLLEQATGSFTALKDAPGMFGGLGALAKPALMATAPIMADAMVQTATAMPTGQRYQGTIRPYKFDPYTKRWTAQPTYPATPVNTAPEPNPQEQQPPSGYRGGGIVALANGGTSPNMTGSVAEQNVLNTKGWQSRSGLTGIEGLNSNINMWFNEFPQAKESDIRSAMQQYGLNDADIMRATGKSVGELAYKPPVAPTPAPAPVVAPEPIPPAPATPGTQGPSVEFGGDTVIPEYTAPQPQVTLGEPFKPVPQTMDQLRTDYEQGGGSTAMPTITTLRPGEKPMTQNAVVDKLQAYLDANPNATSGDIMSWGRANAVPEYQLRAAINERRFSTMTGGTKNAYDYLMGRGEYPTTPFVPGGGPLMRPYSEVVGGAPTSAMSRFRPTMPPSGGTTDKSTTTTTTGGTTKTTGTTTPSVDTLRTSFDKSIFSKSPEEKAAYYNSLLGQGYTDEQIRAAINAPLDDNWLALRAIAERLRAGTTGSTTSDNTTTGGTTENTGGTTRTTGGGTTTTGGGITLLDRAGTGSSSTTTDTETTGSGTPITDFLFGTQDYRDVPVVDRSTYSEGALQDRGDALIREHIRQDELSYGGSRWNPEEYSNLFRSGGLADVAAMAAAQGGNVQRYNLGGYSDGGRLLRGPGDGVSDSIPATIGNKQPARLADGEFVIPARIVSEIGNGSTEAGARKLYAMMDRVQRARAKTTGKGKVAKNTRAEKYLPA